MHPTVVPIVATDLKAACSRCNLRELCLPMGLAAEDVSQMSEVVYTRRRVARGQALFRARDEFTALYAVRVGFFKTVANDDNARAQVTGFSMPGELMGLDGIVDERHSCDAVALEDAEVCVIPYSMLERFLAEHPSLQRQIHRLMSREIVRDQGIMMLLGNMKAEERLAAFLLSLSQRFGARGFSAREFVLRMTRDEIGSFLGLKLETVSRAFSKLQADGLIDVNQKYVHIQDMGRLRSLANAPAANAPI
jgi:CRP/FNR family transcriptional regulator, anaerobic regulatory protein